jgi:HEAT repeat protein
LNKRRSISALVIVLAAAVFCAVWLNRGPRYQGKSARHWVGQLVRNETAARSALLELGPAGVPALAEVVSARQSWLEKKLGSFRPRLPRWIARRLLSQLEADVRQQRALEVLDDLAPSAALALPALLDLDGRVSDDFFIYSVSARAQRVILKIGEAGLPQLIQVLRRGKEPATRAKAAMYLGLIGARAAPASGALAKALHDASPAVRKEAVTALDQIGPPAADALPALRAALELDNDDFRLHVVQALWDIGHDVELTVPILVKVLRDPQNPSRARAATILARMGPAAKAAAPALTAVTQEEFSYTRVKAEEALKQIGGRPADPGTDKLE